MSSTIWLIDRSRVVDGRGFCNRARLNGYHLGPTGYGIAMKATKVPLMTGIIAHDGLAPILQWALAHDAQIVEAFAHYDTLRQEAGPQVEETVLPVPTGVVRGAVQRAQQKYAQIIAVRGFAYLAETEEQQQVVREQNYLIEGLIWAWCLEVLPHVLRRCRIVEVEHDDTLVFDCTCGLGDGIGTKTEHEARDCQGKGLMCRPDFLAETRQTLELEYHEFKTTGMDSTTFRDKWEVMIQMFAATLDAERRLEKQVGSVYVHGLIKGKREGDYNPETGKRDGTYRQSSVFCYGYRKPGAPPAEREEWAATYDYLDPYDGRNRKLGKAFRKTGVWELPDSMIPDGMSKAEFWAKWIPAEARRKQLVLLGPFSRQELMVPHFLQEASGEENRWQQGLWDLYDLAQTILGEAYPGDGGPSTLAAGIPANAWWEVVWPDDRFQALIDRLFPRSYECRRYGMRNRCQFERMCFYREGWADPIGSGFYVDRRPHHQDELEQAIERGLLLPEEGLAEDLEWELP